MKILFCGEDFAGARIALQEALPEFDVVSCPLDDILANLDGVDVIVPAMAAVGAAVMDRGSFTLIQQFATGVENIDLAAAQSRGIHVANIPTSNTGNADAVAELALLHLLAGIRRFGEAEARARRGELGSPVGESLVGRRVAVVGFGAVGREVVRRLRSFKADVVVIGRRQRADHAADLAELDVDTYYPVDDIATALHGVFDLIVCAPLTPETRGMIGRDQLQALSPGGVVVNVARGALVDREALIEALRHGHIAGAGLDVFWHEPPDPDDEIFAENVTVTPHIAGVTHRSYRMMASVAAENIRRFADGLPPLTPVRVR